MKKLLMLALGIGMIFAVVGCKALDNADSHNSIENSSNTSSWEESSSEVSNDSTDNSADDSSVVSPPTIDGENELPLIPIE